MNTLKKAFRAFLWLLELVLTIPTYLFLSIIFILAWIEKILVYLFRGVLVVASFSMTIAWVCAAESNNIYPLTYIIPPMAMMFFSFFTLMFWKSDKMEKIMTKFDFGKSEEEILAD